MRSVGFAVAAVPLTLLAAAAQAAGTTAEGERAMKTGQSTNAPATFTLRCAAFSNMQRIPVRHTGDGEDASPALSWQGAPTGTKAFALICDDPDAPVGDWVHWVIYDLPPTAAALRENVARTADGPGGSKQGCNDFRRTGYNGPAPPRGKPHRYFFKLFALDRPTGLSSGATKAQLLKAIEGHVLAKAELVGTYSR